MKYKIIFKKFTVFLLGLFFCALGTAISTRANLGTVPISTLSYLFTFLCPLSFGTTTFILNFIFLLLQIAILKKDFKKSNYLQILLVIFFGYFIDLGMHLSEFFITDNYILNLIMLIVGIIILAFGITLERFADFYLPGDGLVRAITSKSQISFDKVKIGFDTLQVVLTIIISLIMLHNITGVREGTVISAVLVGFFVGLFSKILKV